MREHFHDMDVIEQGFTLIEILVLIVILGVLAAVAVFAVTGISSRGESSACKSEVSQLNTAIEAYYAKTDPGSYPAGPGPSQLGAQLIGAKLLTASSIVPGATLGHAPAYDSATGNYTATCT